MNPLLTAYLDARDAYMRTPSARKSNAWLAAQTAWFDHVRDHSDIAAILLALLADPTTGGPHISPDAPDEVWGAWRGVMGVDELRRAGGRIADLESDLRNRKD